MTDADTIAAHRRFTFGIGGGPKKGKWVIFYQPRPRQTDHGLAYVVGWPALELTGTVQDPPFIAQMICDLLNEHWPESKGGKMADTAIARPVLRIVP